MQSMDPAFNEINRLEAIVKFMAASCCCHLTASQLTDRAFLCRSSSQSVIYMAQLCHTFQAPIFDLITRVQEWAFSGYSGSSSFLRAHVCLITHP